MLYNNKLKKESPHEHTHTHTKNHENHTHCDINDHNDIDETAINDDQTLLDEDHHKLIWKVEGMDCASCAKKVENGVKSLPDVINTRIIFATEKLIVTTDVLTDDIVNTIEEKIRSLGYTPIKEGDKNTQSHEHAHNMNKKDIINVAILGALIVLSFIITLINARHGSYAFIVTSIVGLIPILHKAYVLTRSGTPFAIESLMSISAIGALFIGAAEEASMVLFLFMIGEMLEAVAANKARKGISSLVSLMPDTAVILVDGQRQTVSSKSLKPGDILEASSGSRLPADVELVSEIASIDESALTGESMPVEYHRGDKIMAGSMIVDKTVQLRVVSKVGQNAVDRILQLIEDAEERKAPIERFIDKFSRYYTPSIALIAFLVMIIPPLIAGQEWYPWVYRGLTLLLIGCPCALVISTPASITSALSSAARQGVLIKGGAALELLGHIKTIAFDKTGTLTEGKPKVTDLISGTISEQQLLQKAAAIEMGSAHPLAKAIINKASALDITAIEAMDRQAIAGIGIKGVIDNELIYIVAPNKAQSIDITIGHDWLSSINTLEGEGKTVVVVTNSQQVLGLIALQDEMRPEALQAINALKALGINPIMLTGDNARSAKAIAQQLDITYRAELLPIDKLREIENLSATSMTAMIGDGINDSPAIKAATVGIAMGGGTDVALETADAALTKNNLLSIPNLIKLARAANSNVRQNITIALGFKAIFLITSLLGITGLWIAVLADSGTTAIVTANALRLLKYKSK